MRCILLPGWDSVQLESIAKRFWTKIEVKKSGCWEWHGARTPGGYGKVTLPHGCRVASRVAVLLTTNQDPGDLNVCHICDNPPCVRPDHLFVATQKENMEDCRDKGRISVRRGEKSTKTKLQDAQVEKILRRYAKGDVGIQQLASEHRLKYHLVASIVHRQSWCHVAPEIEKAPLAWTLDQNKADEIRERFQKGERVSVLALCFGVGKHTVYQVLRKERWKNTCYPAFCCEMPEVGLGLEKLQAQGKSALEITTELGCHHKTVYRRVGHLIREDKATRNATILNYRSNGMPRNVVAFVFGLDEGTILRQQKRAMALAAQDSTRRY